MNETDPQLPQGSAPAAPSIERAPASGRGRERTLAIPEWARHLSRLLDSAIRVPGTDWTFGLDPIIGAVLPELGDALTALLSLTLLFVAYRQRVPKAVLGRMLVNIAIDAILGAIPVLGDAFDFAFKANVKNLELIEKHSRNPELPATLGDRLVVAAAVVTAVVLAALPVLVAVGLFELLLKLVTHD